MICGIHIIRGASFARYGGILAVAACIVTPDGEVDSTITLIKPEDRFNYQPKQLRDSRLTLDDLAEKGMVDGDAFEHMDSWIFDRRIQRALVLDNVSQEWLIEWGFRNRERGQLPKLLTPSAIEETLKFCGVNPEPFIPNADLADSKGIAKDLALWMMKLLGTYTVTQHTPAISNGEARKEVGFGRV